MGKGSGGGGITDFSFALNNQPFTIPDNNSVSTDTTKAYENLGDGLWYFHVKAKKEGVWGNTTHFLLRVDTTPPADFKPKVAILSSAIAGKVLVSFFTTDALSGIDHYEVGLIDKKGASIESPAFVQTESPYQINNAASDSLRIIVRAFDRAGNVRDSSVDIGAFSFYSKSAWLLLITVIFLIIHYLYGHKILANFEAAVKFFKKRSEEEL